MESSLLFWVMMMSVLGWRCFGCLEQERHALLTLKANINYPYFDADGELSSWEACMEMINSVYGGISRVEEDTSR